MKSFTVLNYSLTKNKNSQLSITWVVNFPIFTNRSNDKNFCGNVHGDQDGHVLNNITLVSVTLYQLFPSLKLGNGKTKLSFG